MKKHHLFLALLILSPSLANADPSSTPAPTPNPQVNSCFDQIKKNFTNRMPFTEDALAPEAEATLLPIIKQFNDAIKNGSGSDPQYSRSTIEGMTYQVGFSQNFAMNGLEFDISYQLNIGTSQDPTQPISLSINGEMKKDGSLVGTIEQLSTSDLSCIPQLQTNSYTGFQYQGKKVTLTKTDSSADHKAEISDPKTINRSLVDNYLISEKYDDTSTYPQQASMHMYGDFDTVDANYKIQQLPDSEQFDPIKNQKVQFHTWQLLGKQGDKVVLSTLASRSTISNYATTQDNDKTEDQITSSETVNADLWNQTVINMAVDVSNSSDSSNSPGAFSSQEVSAPDFSLEVISDKKIEQDNISAYGQLTLLDAKDGQYGYKFTPKSAAPAPAKMPIDKNAYTKETKYFDYSSPKVAELVAAVKKIASSNDPAVLAKTILQVMSDQKISFDNTAVNDVTIIRPMKASDVVKEKSGVCQNYAALYVAIARGLGIPAKVEGGYALEKDDDTHWSYTGHAWVELSLDGHSWTPLEPQLSPSELPTSGYLSDGKTTCLQAYLPMEDMNIFEQPIGADANLFEKDTLTQNIWVAHLPLLNSSPATTDNESPSINTSNDTKRSVNASSDSVSIAVPGASSAQ